MQLGRRSGWLKPERSMWPMPVVMLDVDAQHLLQMAASQISSQSRRSARKRSSKARQSGRGRAKLHYLNPVPLHQVQERWIDKFERPRLRALTNLKRQTEEEMTDRPTYVYVTYIHSTADACGMP